MTIIKFKQLEEYEFFNRDKTPKGKALGYCLNEGNKWLLWKNKEDQYCSYIGSLRPLKIERYWCFRHIDYIDTHSLYRKTVNISRLIEFDRIDKTLGGNKLTDFNEHLDKINPMLDFLNTFVSGLNKVYLT